MIKSEKVISIQYEPFGEFPEAEMLTKFGLELRPEKEVITVRTEEARRIMKELLNHFVDDGIMEIAIAKQKIIHAMVS